MIRAPGYGPILLPVQHESERDPYRVGDPLRALPIALASTKIQTLELRGADELGRSVRGNELKSDRHLLCYAAQCQGADRGVSVAEPRDAAGNIVPDRKMHGVENIGSPNGLVAILVLRVNRSELDLNVYARSLERIRVEFHGRSVFVKRPSKFRSRLRSGKFQFARTRSGGITQVRGRCVQPGRGAQGCGAEGHLFHDDFLSD
jgi:hypothetical protein